MENLKYLQRGRNNLKLFSCLLTLMLFGGTYAQVGINNSSPQSTLDVTGKSDDITVIDGVIAPRLTGSQLKNKDNLYTSSQDGTIVYITEPLSLTQTTARTINVLEKGYYGFNSSLGTVGQWVSMFNRNPVVIEGVDILNRLVIPETILNSSGTTNAALHTKQFTLTRKSLVDVSFSVPVMNFVRANGQNLTDGTSKMYGINVFLDKLDAPTFSNMNILRDSESFTNAGSFYAFGIFQLGNDRKFVLEAGTYTIRFVGFVYSNPGDTVGVRATFGYNGNANDDVKSVIDIIATPMDK